MKLKKYNKTGSECGRKLRCNNVCCTLSVFKIKVKGHLCVCVSLALLCSEKVMRVNELDATIQMLLYTDASYTKAFSSAPTIHLRDKVAMNIQLLVQEVDQALKL